MIKFFMITNMNTWHRGNRLWERDFRGIVPPLVGDSVEMFNECYNEVKRRYLNLDGTWIAELRPWIIDPDDNVEKQEQWSYKQ